MCLLILLAAITGIAVVLVKNWIVRSYISVRVVCIQTDTPISLIWLCAGAGAVGCITIAVLCKRMPKTIWTKLAFVSAIVAAVSLLIIAMAVPIIRDSYYNRGYSHMANGGAITAEVRTPAWSAICEFWGAAFATAISAVILIIGSLAIIIKMYKRDKQKPAETPVK